MREEVIGAQSRDNSQESAQESAPDGNVTNTWPQDDVKQLADTSWKTRLLSMS